MASCKFKVLLTASVVLFFSLSTFAQVLPPPPCTTNLQSSMLCVIPQAYGVNGLILPNPNHAAHFEGSESNQFFLPLNASVGTELSLLSIASPASGVLLSFDKSLGVVTRSTESFGPILAERAETIGRHRFLFGAAYQYFSFGSLDGIDLKHLPVVFAHAQFKVGGVNPPYEQDYITSENRINIKANEVTLYGSFGLTNRIDVSVAVPILHVSTGIVSNAHVVRIAPQPVLPGDPFYSSAFSLTPNGPGYFHFFNASDPAGSINQVFSNSNSASGIGDVEFRVKGTVINGERTRMALGMDFRTPTGDDKSFLGTGAPGFKPFLAASYRARISPHVNLGFEYNGSSILAGNVGTGKSGKLPNQFFYSFGADARVNKRLTVAADLLGTRLSSTQRIRRAPFVDVNGITQPNVAQIALYKDSVNMEDLSLGAKYSIVGNLLLTGNIAIQVNDGGLRARVVPLASLSYSF
jgi:hypothetical protein